MCVVDQSVAEIKLSNGDVVIVDAEDYKRLSKYGWRAAHGGRYAYVTVPMHRFIIEAPEGTEVDHINGNVLDNRKENLRVCTRSQNIANTRKPRRKKGCSSVFKGVSWDKTNKTWVARVQPNGKVYRKTFKTELAAARAYDEMAKQHFGEFARTNFP